MISRVIIVTNVYSTNDTVRCRRATRLLVACGRVGRKVSTAAALWHSDARAAGTTTHGIPPQPPANNSDDCRQQNDKTIQISVCRSVHVTHEHHAIPLNAIYGIAYLSRTRRYSCWFWME